MANKTLNATLIIRHGTAAEWAAQNPILKKGELGYEIDTGKSKIGDGITEWNDQKYASGTPVAVRGESPATGDTDYDVGALWLDTAHNTVYFLAAKNGTALWLRLANASELAVVDEAKAAQKLKTARSIGASGAATGSASFDGSGDITIVLALADSGVTAGTYTKLTVNAKGVVTSAAQVTAADIPSLTLSKITDAGTAAGKNAGTAAGNVPLIGSDGKLPESLIPSVAITDVFEVGSEGDMLALSNAEKGDVAIRTDNSTVFILFQTPATTLANWKQLVLPVSVLSVNGQTGAVTLTTSNIAEGSNKYYTEDRAAASFSTNFAAKSVTGLSDGAAVVLTTDTVTINGGVA
ncbi:MAG: hypothetical protein LBL66_04595 [Clostridiales bacterium]|jgi:uncharacterized protein YxeA|nr:hypothetical protein [Clostridiales bacterium]